MDSKKGDKMALVAEVKKLVEKVRRLEAEKGTYVQQALAVRTELNGLHALMEAQKAEIANLHKSEAELKASNANLAESGKSLASDNERLRAMCAAIEKLANDATARALRAEDAAAKLCEDNAKLAGDVQRLTKENETLTEELGGTWDVLEQEKTSATSTSAAPTSMVASTLNILEAVKTS